ncbi:hypothetical protein HDU97_005147 [Phlyctochytrium planicorne]|nr:hypothetical protein HDU97_005147 [Phlyctochytrium planicorne]
MTRRELPSPRGLDDHRTQSQQSSSPLVAGFTPKIKNRKNSLTGTVTSATPRQRKISSVTSLPSLEATASANCLTGSSPILSNSNGFGASVKSPKKRRISRSKRSRSGKSGRSNGGTSSTQSSARSNRLRLPSVVLNGTGSTSIVRAAAPRPMYHDDVELGRKPASQQGFSQYSYRSDMSLSRSYVDSTTFLANVGGSYSQSSCDVSHRDDNSERSNSAMRKPREEESKRMKAHKLKKIDPMSIKTQLSTQPKENSETSTRGVSNTNQRSSPDTSNSTPPATNSSHRKITKIGHQYLRKRNSTTSSIKVIEADDNNESDGGGVNDSFDTIAPWKRGTSSREDSSVSKSFIYDMGSNTTLRASDSSESLASRYPEVDIKGTNAFLEEAQKAEIERSPIQSKLKSFHSQHRSDPELPSISTLEAMASPDFVTLKEILKYAQSTISEASLQPPLQQTSSTHSSRQKAIPAAVEAEDLLRRDAKE